MKNKSKLGSFLLPIFISIFLVVSTSCLFIFQMNKMIEGNTLNTINELVEHDMATIIQYIDSEWSSLRNIAKRLEVYDCHSVNSAQERLNLERSTSDFYGLFLVDEDDVVYSDKYMVYKNGEFNIISELKWQNRKEVVRRFDYAMTLENQREVLIFGIKLDNYKIGDKKINILIGISDIT